MKLSDHKARTRSAIEQLLGEVETTTVGRDTQLRREGDRITVSRDDTPLIAWDPDGSAVLTLGDSPQAFRNRVDNLGPEGVSVHLGRGRVMLEDVEGQRLALSRGVPVRVSPDGRILWNGVSLLDRLPPYGDGGITRAIEVMLLTDMSKDEILAEVHRRFPEAGTTDAGIRHYRHRLRKAGILHD